MHEHNPSKYKNPVIRFLSFLLSPIELYGYYMYGADICDECKTDIRLPDLYFNPFLKGAYILAGGVIGYVISQIPYLRTITATFLTIAFHHIASSIILSISSWPVFDRQVYGIESAYRDAQKDLKQKALCVIVGSIISIIFLI